MTEPFRHKPWATAQKPFSIGLSAIDPASWIEPTAELDHYLDEKDHLLATRRDTVFRETEGSREAQAEALTLITRHILTDHDGPWRRTGERIDFGARSVRLDDPDIPPLVTAGRLVADDLVVLTKVANGWRLAAGFVAFPSAWSLPEKAGLVMEEVHGDVPGFSGGTRNAEMLRRIFDNLQPDLPAMRFNWSIYPSAALYWPPEENRIAMREPVVAPQNVLRIERQTLRRLPETGAILFTIRIYLDPLARLAGDPAMAGLAGKIADKIEEFSDEQLAYKSLTARKAALVDWLRKIG